MAAEKADRMMHKNFGHMATFEDGEEQHCSLTEMWTREVMQKTCEASQAGEHTSFLYVMSNLFHPIIVLLVQVVLHLTVKNFL